MNGRGMPSGPMMLVLGICVGMSAVYWYAGGREFDIWMRKLFFSAKEAAKARTPPSPPPRPRPRPDPQREAALRARQEAAAALRTASSMVAEARKASEAWGHEGEPLLDNYDGHLIAANLDLVQRFRVLHRSVPPKGAMKSLEERLASHSSVSDLASHQQALALLRGDAASVRDGYRQGLAGAAEIVAVARARRLWTPVELFMAMWSLDSGIGVRPTPGATRWSYDLDIPPWHPLARRLGVQPPPRVPPRAFYPPPYPPRWRNP